MEPIQPVMVEILSVMGHIESVMGQIKSLWDTSKSDSMRFVPIRFALPCGLKGVFYGDSYREYFSPMHVLYEECICVKFQQNYCNRFINVSLP